MSEKVVLDLPEDLAQRVRAAAAASHRTLEAVLVDYIERATSEPPVESLPDAEVLALCDAEMDEAQQEELSQLLAKGREGKLQLEERNQLDDLMHIYRRGLVRKAKAFQAAVQRGLLPPLQ